MTITTISALETATVYGGFFGGVQEVVITQTGTVAVEGGGFDGVQLTNNAYLQNSGLISANTGINVLSGGSIANTGTIDGGFAGVLLNRDGTLDNFGRINGSQYYGVSLAQTDSLANFGTIYGAKTGVYDFGGGTINDVSITNGGMIAGGKYAVFAYGPLDLTVDPGATFVGKVVDREGLGQITLAGTIAGSIDFGNSFAGFEGISFANDAQWTLQGSVSDLASGQNIVGFSDGDTLVIDNFQETAASYISGIGISLSNNAAGVLVELKSELTGDVLVSQQEGATTIAASTATTGAILGPNAQEWVFSGGVARETTVNNGSTLIIGGLANNSFIEAGGFEMVQAGGVSANNTIDGGILDLSASSGAPGVIKFEGAGGELTINKTALTNALIEGFAPGDKITFGEIPANVVGTVSVEKADMVTVSAGGDIYKLNIAGAAVGSKNFQFANSVLTETASPKMVFLHPEAVAPQPYELTITTECWMPQQPETARLNAFPSSAARPVNYHGFITVAHGGVQIIPGTL